MPNAKALSEIVKSRNDLAELREAEALRFDLLDKGKIRLPIFLRPCRMKILILVDNANGFVSITYGRLYFSLSELVKTLENDPDWWVQFDLTKAHRQTDVLGEADVENFRFTDASFDINEYDQVWFFGAGTSTNFPAALHDDELEILYRWMNEKQGGVFACGDHWLFGQSLGSRIPRVRNMRKWTSAQGVPNSNDADRHDTLVKGHDAVYTFNDESDDIPMRTRLRRYPLWSTHPFHPRWRPHPVMCGRDGPIDILPDHPHEGEVIVPSNTGQNVTFNGYTSAEYPGGSGKPVPEIIAWARVQGDHTVSSDPNKGPANGKEFGAVGAYDGHSVDVGRVVVDSTWHHWMDVNLIGRPTGPGQDPIDAVLPGDPKAEGFTHSPAGRQALARIKNYFLNVAQWLGSPRKQRCMFKRATWGCVVRYPLAESLSPKLPIWVLGGYARDAIGRRASQCAIRSWLWPLLPHLVEKFEFEIDWDKQIGPRLGTPSWDAFETIVIGGVTRAMLKVAYDFDSEKGEISEKVVAEAMAKGLSAGVKEFETLTKESHEAALKLERKLAKKSVAKFSARDFLGDG